jgi:hypothetical protein
LNKSGSLRIRLLGSMKLCCVQAKPEYVEDLLEE